MKILVVDDLEVQRQAARQTLAGHDLTIVEGYDEALSDFGIMDSEMRFQKENPAYDVMLTDLLMPGGSYQSMGWAQQEAMGFPLALLAAQRGIKVVGVVSSGSHHNHPAMGALDYLSGFGRGLYMKHEPLPTTFTINGAKVGFFGQAPVVHVEGTVCESCSGSGEDKFGGGKDDTHYCNGTGKAKGKDWGRVLRFLTTGE